MYSCIVVIKSELIKLKLLFSQAYDVRLRCFVIWLLFLIDWYSLWGCFFLDIKSDEYPTSNFVWKPRSVRLGIDWNWSAWKPNKHGCLTSAKSRCSMSLNPNSMDMVLHCNAQYFNPHTTNSVSFFFLYFYSYIPSIS